MPTPRKPTKEKINEGDAHRLGKHVLAAKLASEPRPQSGLAPASERLPGLAREVYEFWRAELRLMQLDHCPDAVALEGAAMAYCRAVEAELSVEREGAVVNEPVFYQGKRLRGVTRPKKHPAVTIATGAWLLFRTFAREFGLTPLSRTRLTIEGHKDADDDLNESLS